MKLKIEKNVSVANLTTFCIGGRADYFTIAKTKKEILEALKWAQMKKIPFFILGGGSNVLFSDKGFRGLIIKIHNTKYQIHNTKIIAEAGCPLQRLVKESAKKGLEGLDFLAGIPGTLGGAIRGNAGAFGREIRNLVEKVKILKMADGKWQMANLKKKDCRFDYRESIFKKKKNWIILEATLKLKKSNKKKVEKKMKEILKMRKERQPLNYKSAGSVFKNVSLKDVPKKVVEKFREKIKDSFLPAGALIEAVGLKGKKVGGAKISEKHANFIVNFEKAKAKNVIALIKLVKRKIKEKFNIDLQEEIELVGF